MELGASDTTEFDKMMGALGMLSGSKAGAKKAFDAASAMYAPVEEANPWEASLRFFLEMGKQASQPGATVLGSAVGSGLVPLDYLTAKKKEKRDRRQKVASTAFSLAPTLKPKAATYRDPKEYTIEMPIKDADGNITGYKKGYVDFLTAKGFADLQKQGARFSSVVKPTGTGSTTFGQYLLTTPEAIAAYKAQGPAFTLTPEQEAGTAPVTISANVLRTAGGFTKYEKAGSGAADDLKTFALLNPDDLTKIQEVVPNASIDGMGNILLTDAESKKAGVRQYIGQKLADDTSNNDQPKSAKDEYGILRYTANPPEGKNIGDRVFSESQSVGYTDSQLATANTLRDDLVGSLKEFKDIAASHGTIASFYFKEDDAIADYGLSVGFAKIIDPGTAAREGEVAAIASSGSAVGALKAQIMNMVLGTGKLSPKLRAQIYNNSLDIYENQVYKALGKLERYKTVSEKIKTGLWDLVGVDQSPKGPLLVDTDPATAYGAPGVSNKDATNYTRIGANEIASLSDVDRDGSPIGTKFIFPENFDFKKLGETGLKEMLLEPPSMFSSAADVASMAAALREIQSGRN